MDRPDAHIDQDAASPADPDRPAEVATRLLARWLSIEPNSFLDMRLTQRDLDRVGEALSRLAALQAAGGGQDAAAQARLAEAIGRLAASSATLARAVDEFEGFCGELQSAGRTEGGP
jgi:hypothetical protein